jgi:NADPH:quinone reductase-like Zn-dependent oxidoreductase
MPVNGSSAEARAFWVVAPGSGEIRAETLPLPRADEVVVRTLYSGVSRGTEALVFNGRVPPSEYERMRAPFQAGAFPGPVKYGYSSVGIVETAGELEGRPVFALYPHQTRYVIPRAAVQAIPENVPPARAILAANLETAVNGLWDAAPLVGDRITVIGAGTVGCLVAWLAAAIPGCEVELVDINPERAAIAAALGVSFCAPAGICGDADLVIHVSGSPEGLTLALGAAAFEATIVEMSWFGATPVTIPLGEAFHVRRLTLRSSQVGHIAPAQRSRWDFRRRIQLALRLLASSVLDALITGETPFETLPVVMSELASGRGGALCHRISYDQSS